MTKRPPQGRGSGGRVTPSAKAAEAAAASASSDPKAARGPRARVPRSTRAPAAPKPTKAEKATKPAKATTAAAHGDPQAGGSTSVEVATAPVWGMGDMVLWWVLSYVAFTVFYGLVTGYLVSSGRYVSFWPNDEGWAIGEVVGRIGTGQAPQVTVGINGAPLWLQTVFQVPLWAVLVAGPLFVAWKKKLDLRRDFGLAFKAVDAPIGLAVGVASQLLLVPALYWVIFRFTADQDVSASARALTTRADDVWGILALLVIVGVGAPIAEEIFYRGLSQHAIAKRFGGRWAVILGGLFFAFSHLQPLQFPGLLAFGLVLGVLTERFGRIGPAIWAHVAFNLTAAVVLLWNLPLA